MPDPGRTRTRRPLRGGRRWHPTARCSTIGRGRCAGAVRAGGRWAVASTDVQGFGVLQGSGEPALRAGEGVGPGQAVRGEGRHGRRQRAAGAVGVRGVDTAARNLVHTGGVDDGIRALSAVQVPALEEDRGVGRCGELFGLGDRGVPCHRDGFAHQYREFGEVGGDEVGAAAECAHGVFGVRLEKAVTAGGDHDGVEDDDRRSRGGEPLVDGGDDVGRAEHADLHRVDVDVVADRAQLLLEEGRRRYVDAADPAGVLGDQGRDRGHSVAAERGDRLQVGLDARPAGRIGAGDAQDAGDHAPSSHAARRCRTTSPGSSASLTRETTATPAAPARRRAVTSSRPIPPIATHGRGVDAASSPNPSMPSGRGWSGFVEVARMTPTPR